MSDVQSESEIEGTKPMKSYIQEFNRIRPPLFLFFIPFGYVLNFFAQVCSLHYYFTQVFPPLGMITLIVVVTYFPIRLFLLKDNFSAGVAALIINLVFFMYSPIHEFFFRFLPLRNHFFIPISLSLSLLVGYLIGRLFLKKVWTVRLSLFVSLATGAVVVFNVGNIIYNYALMYSDYSQLSSYIQPDIGSSQFLDRRSTSPSIYYIVFDEMTSMSMMESCFDADYTMERGSLVDMGFTIAENAITTSPHTHEAILSNLNMDYYDRYLSEALINKLSGVSSETMDFWGEYAYGKPHDLDPAMSDVPAKFSDDGRSSDKKTGLQVFNINRTFHPWLLVSNNQVVRSLNTIEYNTYFIDHFTAWMNLSAFSTSYDTHIYLSGSQPDFGFYRLIEGKSLLSSLRYILSGGESRLLEYTEIYDNILEVADSEGPKFVHAHIVLPHPPIIYGENGRLTEFDANLVNNGTSADFLNGYVGQYNFCLNQIIEISYKIIERDPNSIIVMQSDHGLRFQNINKIPADNYPGFTKELATGIFYAIRFPDGCDHGISNDFSPVDTFRAIFNEYFNTDYEYAIKK